ncbi:uncharacterized protein EAF01_006518 [Botrytis porri]|uniref:uncharacterized protein n=1 Tax=Botrytis porri TaxID=87229 RepID=UPI0018FF7AEB|nr:uncharacterized protein EAF01_006518 [Botrytis porri]KAF7903469.1 hypothetical protein EAF01_006518 [Botrytis porri]
MSTPPPPPQQTPHPTTPRPHLHTWTRHLPASSQSSPSITQIPIFKDSCSVREQVFVYEQRAVPLIHHLDNDDARSVHFVIYAPPNPHSLLSDSDLETSQIPYIPVGTLRLLPYPDTLRPLPHTRIVAGSPTEEIPPSSTFFFQASPTYKINPATTFHDGIEPYIRLGRLAVLKEYRGKGYADILIQAALKWAGEHPRFSEEALREEEKGRVPEWKGLVCLYARDVAVRTWERNGFVVDEGMGSWWEVGVRILGMVQRVSVRGDGEEMELRE